MRGLNFSVALCHQFLVTKNIRKKRLTNAVKGHIISNTIENHMGHKHSGWFSFYPITKALECLRRCTPVAIEY